LGGVGPLFLVLDGYVRGYKHANAVGDDGRAWRRGEDPVENSVCKPGPLSRDDATPTTAAAP
ncbi:hypothetical protein, partial [Nocardia brasiliensis]|uniref:hypothetical protein n=1 Tax=Nocardia brasiliensis TaxID=37326 RepID=UPI0024574F05